MDVIHTIGEARSNVCFVDRSASRRLLCAAFTMCVSAHFQWRCLLASRVLGISEVGDLH
jgi:hypothetical protein